MASRRAARCRRNRGARRCQPGQDTSVVFSNYNLNKPLSPYNVYVGVDITPYAVASGAAAPARRRRALTARCLAASFSPTVVVDIDLQYGLDQPDGSVLWLEYQEDTLSTVQFQCDVCSRWGPSSRAGADAAASRSLPGPPRACATRSTWRS